MEVAITLAVLLSIALVSFNVIAANRRAKEEAERKLLFVRLKEAQHLEMLLSIPQPVPLTHGMILLLCGAIERTCRQILTIKKGHTKAQNLRAVAAEHRQYIACEQPELTDEEVMINARIPFSNDARKQFFDAVRALREFIRNESKQEFVQLDPLRREMGLLNFLQLRIIIEIHLERARGAFRNNHLAATYEMIEEVKKVIAHPAIGQYPPYKEKIENDIKSIIEQIKQAVHAREAETKRRRQEFDDGDGLNRMGNNSDKIRWT